jgi:hypothetical protein
VGRDSVEPRPVRRNRLLAFIFSTGSQRIGLGVNGIGSAERRPTDQELQPRGPAHAAIGGSCSPSAMLKILAAQPLSLSPEAFRDFGLASSSERPIHLCAKRLLLPLRFVVQRLNQFFRFF